jgi:hypothetical protein
MTTIQPGHVWLLFFLLVSFVLYFVPTIVAVARQSHLLAAVAVVNVLLGWTFIGWVVAFVMAVMRPTVVSAPPPPYMASGPLYSPDGRYVWNGYQWVPVAPPPPPPGPGSTA